MSEQAMCYTGRVDYERLPPGSIRMIELNPRQSGEPLTATIIRVCLDTYESGESDPYNALSYMWSCDDRDSPLILNNTPVLITQQLGRLFEETQLHLKDDQYVRYWVDQLCIDQDDDEDKAQQIPYMKRIYENATTTPIRLFPALEDGQFAMNLVGRLTSLASKAESGNMLEYIPMSQILGPLNDETLRSWRGLNQIMSHKYWTRTWVLPEASSGRHNCFVVCTTLLECESRGIGVRQLCWMRNFLRHLRNRKPPLEYGIDEIPSSLVGLVDNFRQRREGRVAGSSTLFDWLWLSRRSQCTRQEDKVFAVLPFASDVGDYMNDPFLRPSYSQGCERVYSDLIKWYIMKYKNLNFLGSCIATKYNTTQKPGFDLPSWVPNWTHNSYAHPLPKYQNLDVPVESRRTIYRACGPYSDFIDIVEPPAVDFEATTLFLSGLKIAVVHKVLEAALDGGFCEPEIEMSWRDEFDGKVQYPLTDETYAEAFERTVVADAARSSLMAPISRPGKVAWPTEDAGLTSNERYERDFQLKAATADRRLTFARSDPIPIKGPGVASQAYDTSPPRLGAYCKSFLMGLGRSDVELGDEIWALKGGQVFYVLRRRGTYRVRNIADSPEPGWPSQPSLLWLNGKSHAWDEILTGPMFKFVGECYLHGLMDGEALDIASRRPNERPDVLENMSAKFEEIFVGGISRSQIFVGGISRSQTLIQNNSGEGEEAFEDALAMTIRARNVENEASPGPEVSYKRRWEDVWEVY